MRPRAGWGWAAAAGLLVALVVDRWLIHRCCGHLLFHIDGAEYFYLLAMAPFQGYSTLELLTDAHAREAFFRCCTQVADLALHGSTIPPGILLHAIVEGAGAPWSTGTLKALALAHATLTMVLWLVLIGGVWRSPGGLWRFAALALLGPAVFVKLNLLHWGTHEQVMLWHAGFMLVVGPWVLGGQGGRPRPARPAVRAVVLGLTCAGLLLINGSLLIPGLFTLAWVAVADGRRWGRNAGQGAAAGAGLLALGLAAGAFGWWAVTRVELVQALGFQAAFWRDPKMDEALTIGAFHGPWDALRSAGAGSWSLLPGVVLAVAIVVGRIRVRRPADPLLFLSVYLLVAWLILSVLPVAYDQHGVWRPRFLAHLWPVSFAVFALWCGGRPGWLRHGVLIAALAAGLPVQWARLDLANLGAADRYDGARLFELTYDEEGALPADRVRLPSVDPGFIQGFGILRSYQTMEYWDWTPPRRAARMDHGDVVEGYLGAVGVEGVRPGAFFEGVGYGYRVLLPPSRSDRFETVVARFPAYEEELRAGYERDVLPDSVEVEPVEIALDSLPGGGGHPLDHVAGGRVAQPEPGQQVVGVAPVEPAVEGVGLRRGVGPALAGVADPEAHGEGPVRGPVDEQVLPHGVLLPGDRARSGAGI